jgi:hypothetical protein
VIGASGLLVERVVNPDVKIFMCQGETQEMRATRVAIQAAGDFDFGSFRGAEKSNTPDVILDLAEIGIEVERRPSVALDELDDRTGGNRNRYLPIERVEELGQDLLAATVEIGLGIPRTPGEAPGGIGNPPNVFLVHRVCPCP